MAQITNAICGKKWSPLYFFKQDWCVPLQVLGDTALMDNTIIR